MNHEEVNTIGSILNWKEACRRSEIDYQRFQRWSKTGQGLKAEEVSRLDSFLLSLGESLLNNA